MSDKKREYIHFIDDIANGIRKIELYIKNQSFEEFAINEMMVDAVIRNFEVIGEAANRVPDEVRKKYPFVEWSEAIGFRNILIHNYFGIDVEAVWDTIKGNIPELKKHISMALESEKSNMP